MKPYKSEFHEFIEEFKKESDRAAVVLGAAKLDLLLYQLLIKVFLPNVGNKDDLFDGEAPLSTFNAKIHIAYRLGLIDSELTHALHLIRKIRNDFSHEATGCKLNSGTHRDRVKELVLSLKNYDDFNRIKEKFFSDRSVSSAEFRTALALTAGRLEGAVQYVEPSTITKTPRTLIPDAWLIEKDKNINQK